MKLYARKSVLFPVFLLSMSGSLLTAFSIHDCIGRKSDGKDLLTDEKKSELKEIWFKDPAKNVGVGTVAGAVVGVLAHALTKEGKLDSATVTGALIGALGGAGYSCYKAWKQNKSIRAVLKTNNSDVDQSSLSTATAASQTDASDIVDDEDGQESDEVASLNEEVSQSTFQNVMDNKSDFIQKFDEGFIQ